MKTSNYIVFIFILFGSILNAQEYKPSPVPDRIILTWQTDPTTSQAVTWRTDTSIAAGIAQIAFADPSPDFVINAKSYNAKTVMLETDNGKSHYHTVNFNNLEPEHLYAYRVGSDKAWSEWFHFRTASTQSKPFSFIYFGDAQNDLKSMWSRIIRQAYNQSPDASFMIHAGDLIDNANNDIEWGEWFYAGGWLFGMIPSIATPGNHEYKRYIENGKRIYSLSEHWRAQFSFPENGPPGFEETVYYLDYQDVRIISLNSYEMIHDSNARAIQSHWLKDVLKSNPNNWTIITSHYPIFSTSQGRDNSELRKTFKPIFDQYKVDLVLQGHDHTYGRGQNLPDGASYKDEIFGTMYVVSISGPKMYSVTTDIWMDRTASRTQLFQIIKIDGDILSFEAYTAINELYDAFDLVKQKNKPNRVIDKIPKNVPERIE
jgi:acid phosphatase type 7